MTISVTDQMEQLDYSALLDFWGRTFRERLPQLDPPGSPERSVWRTAVADTAGRRYVLEAVDPVRSRHRQSVAQRLAVLRDQGLDLAAGYLPARPGVFVIEYAGRHWQLSPYVEGLPLARPEYVRQGWRGDAAASFLNRLRQADQSAGPEALAGPVFSVWAYIEDFLRRVRRHNPEVLPRLLPVYSLLGETLRPAEPDLPAAFCHGDYHPLNIIWGPDKIRGVIDWEFMGRKPELYDIANLISCVGFEDPEALLDDLVLRFLQGVRSAGLLCARSEAVLLDYVLGLRMAWLAEWLRKRDAEMLSLELDYIELLCRLRDPLRAAWKAVLVSA